MSSFLHRADVRLLVLTGPGGVGKTRLALRVAEGASEAFPDGVVFVPLAPIREPDLVPPTVAAAFGLRDAGAQPLRERLAAFLGTKRLLLVLDNFEQVLPAAPEVAALLAACPGLTALVTSRAVLNVAGEHDLRVPPLALPESLTVHAADLHRAEAVRLFVERAAAARDDFALTEGNAADVVAICRRVDGLPLAIELAAARIAHLPPAALRARLDRQLALLTGGPQDQPARLRSMRDAIAWSFDLLPAQEQVVFRRLAVFVGGCTLEAAEAVCSEDLGIDILDGLASLIDTSLLRQEEGSGGEPRYLMLETIREYGLEQLTNSGEEDRVRQRHAAYFAAFAQTVEPLLWGPEELTLLDRCEEESANLRAATDWSATHDPAPGLRIAASLWWYWRSRAGLSVGRAAVEQALKRIDGVAAPLVAEAKRTLGFLATYQSDYGIARVALEESQRLFDHHGDAAESNLTALHRAVLEVQAGAHGDAEAMMLHALDGVRQRGQRVWEAITLLNLGRFARFIRPDAARAESLIREALALFREVGFQSGVEMALFNIGEVLLHQGRNSEAEQVIRESLALPISIQDRYLSPGQLDNLARVLAAKNEHERATRLMAAADRLRRDVGMEVSGVLSADHERFVQALRERLGPLRFNSVWEAGRALRLEQAVAEARAVAALPIAPAAAPMSAAQVDAGLTPREREVLGLLVEGRSDKEIADALSISSRTVGAHVTHLLTKLGVESRTAAAIHAMRHGLA